MAVEEEEEAFSTFFQELSSRLAAASTLVKPKQPDTVLEMRKLSEFIQGIAPFLNDAKAKQRKRSNIRAWLRRVKDIAYDIDSILHLLSLEGKINKNMHPKIAQEMKVIGKRLVKVVRELCYLDLHESPQQCIKKMMTNHSPIGTLTLLGKDEDHQEKIIKILLSVKEENQIGPSIIPIVKSGGSTRLAQLVINDERVVTHFKRRIWVSASEAIDSSKLSRLIQKPASTIFWVHKTLDDILEDSWFLLILDDVKNQSVEQRRVKLEVDKISNPSKILVTTSQIEMVKMTFTVRDSLCCDERLSPSDSWIMFKKCAFNNPQLEAIGRNVMEKLEAEGLPSLIWLIKPILSLNREPNYWKVIMESDVWKLPVVETPVLSVLARLCYEHHLSSWISSRAYFWEQPLITIQ